MNAKHIKKKPLNVAFRNNRVEVEGAGEVEVTNAEVCKNIIQYGIDHRKTSPTMMNADSSRSHLCVILKFTRESQHVRKTQEQRDKEAEE